MMRFYEELGLPDDASPEALKEAYHTLVRLLHPDQQTDPALRGAAERQLRRVNQAYALLSDPEKRRRYDEERLPIIVQAPPPLVRKPVGPTTLAWGAAVLAVGGFLLWLAGRDVPAELAHEPSSGSLSETAAPRAAAANGPRHTAEQELIAALKSQLRQAIQQRNQAIAAAQAGHAPLPHSVVSAASAEPPEGPPPNEIPSSSGAAIPFAPKLEPPPLAASPASAPPPGFTGAWFWTRPRTPNKNKALYLPEYVEAQITESGGILHGRYRSRYVIPDRAISPEVDFRFEGAPGNSSSVQFPWRGAGNARGLVQLKLLPDGAMEIQWTAVELGSSMGLASGTAVLKRRAD